MRPLPFIGERTYAVLFWSACAFWILPEIIAARVRRSAGSANAHDHGSLSLIAVLWVFGISLDVWLSFWVPQATIPRERVLLFSAGLGLMIGGTAFRWYSASLLGKYFTFDVAVHSGQTIVEKGPYRYVRHPSYTGALLSLLGFGRLCCLGAAYAYRIPVEERALASALGDPYREYLKRTWRLVPFLV